MLFSQSRFVILLLYFFAESEKFIYSLVLYFFVNLPLFHSGLNAGVALVFHLSRLEGIYKAIQISGGGISVPC